MELTPIFSFLNDHINNGGFLKMKDSWLPNSPKNWFFLYQKEFGQISLKMHEYLKENGITETDKIIIKNLINNYLSLINDDFYKIKIGKERVNLLRTLLFEFKNNLLDDIERYQKTASDNEIPQEKVVRIDSEENEKVNELLDDIESYQNTASDSEIPQEKVVRIDSEEITEKEIDEYSTEHTELKTITETVENKNPHSPPKKTFPDYLNYPKKELFATLLKEEFRSSKGMTIKILIIILGEEKILILGDREFSDFYNSMSKYFGNTIGTYQAINDFVLKKTLRKHQATYDTIKLRLQLVIDRLQIQEKGL